MLFAFLCLVVADKPAATEKPGFDPSCCLDLCVELVNRVQESPPEPGPYFLHKWYLWQIPGVIDIPLVSFSERSDSFKKPINSHRLSLKGREKGFLGRPHTIKPKQWAVFYGWQGWGHYFWMGAIKIHWSYQNPTILQVLGQRHLLQTAAASAWRRDFLHCCNSRLCWPWEHLPVFKGTN